MNIPDNMPRRKGASPGLAHDESPRARCACGRVEFKALGKAILAAIADDIPSYPGFPPRFVAKLLLAKIAMMVRR